MKLLIETVRQKIGILFHHEIQFKRYKNLNQINKAVILNFTTNGRGYTYLFPLVWKEKNSTILSLGLLFGDGEGEMYGISLFFFEAKTTTVYAKLIQEK